MNEGNAMKLIKAPADVYGRPATDAERDRLEQFAREYVSSGKTRSNAEVVKLMDLAKKIAHGNVVIGKSRFALGEKEPANVEVVKVVSKKLRDGRKSREKWSAGPIKSAKRAVKGHLKATSESTKD
jgi:hypothetical protein